MPRGDRYRNVAEPDVKKEMAGKEQKGEKALNKEPAWPKGK